MRFVLIRDDAPRKDIEEAIRNLRAKQRKACIQSTRDEIGQDIDELLDLLAKADA